ncbi:hypothetical protein RCCGEPOP_23267 [Rhizobium sp. Pop5]|nr:hypothetical protein RCCGEPOP_23267 [Rhizobium sp. Pop5]
MRFAEDDFAVLHMGGPGDDEHRLPVDLQLRALVGLRRVLDRQSMEIELGLDLMQQHFIRLVQADPDDGVLPVSPLAGLLYPDVANALPMLVDGGRHHTRPLFKPSRRRTATFPCGDTLQILHPFQIPPSSLFSGSHVARLPKHASATDVGRALRRS